MIGFIGNSIGCVRLLLIGTEAIILTWIADDYFRKNFYNEILRLLKKHRYFYVFDYDIINHLVNNGMPIMK